MRKGPSIGPTSSPTFASLSEAGRPLFSKNLVVLCTHCFGVSQFRISRFPVGRDGAVVSSIPTLLILKFHKMIPGTHSVIAECIALLVIVNLVYIARM